MGPNLLGMLPLSFYRKCDSIPPFPPSPPFNHDHTFYPFRRTCSDRKGGARKSRILSMKGPNLLGMLPLSLYRKCDSIPPSPPSPHFNIPPVVRVPIGREGPANLEYSL